MSAHENNIVQQFEVLIARVKEQDAELAQLRAAAAASLAAKLTIAETALSVINSWWRLARMRS